AEHLIVAQTAIRGYVKGADTAVGTDLAPRLFLEAPLVQTTDRYVQDALIRGERQPIGVLALVGGEMDLALGIDAKHAGKTEFPLRGRQTQLRVREIKAAIGATHDIIGFIEPFALPALDNGRDRAVHLHTDNAPVICSFTHEQPALAIEGAAVPLARLFPDHSDLAGRVPAQEPTAGEIDKGDKALRMPDGPFRAPPARGEHRWLGGSQQRRQVLRHRRSPSCHKDGLGGCGPRVRGVLHRDRRHACTARSYTGYHRSMTRASPR